MSTFPTGLAGEIRKAAESPGDIVKQASLLWKVIYHTVDSYRERHPEWMVVRNEDLAVHPFEGFEKLCDFLNVPFDTRMRQTVKEFTTGNTSSSSSGKVPIHSVRRNSKSEAWKWRGLLDPETIERIRKETAPIWKEFYAPEEWKS
jgi:hypothetical protein